jgi:conjugal transfer pilus assembly protein TraD
MNPPPPARRRTPYWMLLALPVLLMLPPVWTAVLAGVAAVHSVIVPGVRALAAWRARSSISPEEITLGVDRAGRAVTLADRQISAHGLILGASGSGKSTTLLRILTEQIRRGAPVVAIDLKGSPAFANRLAEAARASGRPFRLWTPDGPSHWNPLQHGNATELKDKLIGTERFTEPHYQRAAERYLQTVLQVLEHGHRAATTLADVVELMDPSRLAGALRGLPRPLVERIQDYLADLPHDQVSGVRGLGTRLAILTESHTGRYLAPVTTAEARTIDLRAALSGDEVVLFSLNASRYGKLAAQIGTLVVQDLVSAAGDRVGSATGVSAAGSQPRQAFVAIDEFSALGGDQVLALVARGREAGFSTLLATQEFVDLDRAGAGLRDQVIGNTVVKIIHRQDVPASAQLVAQMVGTERVWEQTEQTGGPWLSGYPTGRGTRREAERFVVHPNQIKTLRPGEAVVITKVPTAEVRITQVSPPRPLATGALPAAGTASRAGTTSGAAPTTGAGTASGAGATSGAAPAVEPSSPATRSPGPPRPRAPTRAPARRPPRAPAPGRGGPSLE